MSEDLPSNVGAVLTQLCAKTREALAEGNTDTARVTVDTTGRVATNNRSEGDQCRTVRHACDLITALLSMDPDIDAAGADIEALDRRFPTDS